MQERKRQPVLLVLGAQAESLRRQALGIRKRRGVDVSGAQQCLDGRLEVACAEPDLVQRVVKESGL
jgi:hypothetical protein